ncbi:transposase [Burkholderia plantarii]|nr:transposase [Burkholderia plantarii]
MPSLKCRSRNPIRQLPVPTVRDCQIRFRWLTFTGANRHDSMAFESTLDAIPAVPGLNGPPRKRPSKLHVDKGYDFGRCRRSLRQRGIKARIARRGIESSERLGRHRWVVERTHAWFAGFGKLRIRFERRLDIHTALLVLAAAVICSRFVDDLCWRH